MKMIKAFKVGELLTPETQKELDALSLEERITLHNMLNSTFDMLLDRRNGITYLKEKGVTDPEETMHKLQTLLKKLFDVMEDKLNEEVSKIEEREDN